MVLGYLALGMISGFAAAVFWVATGGHILIAVALYSLVSLAVIITSAVTTWLWSQVHSKRNAPTVTGLATVTLAE